MSAEDDAWIDDAAGPIVRAYAVTGGRARPSGADFDLLTYVVLGKPVSAAEARRLQPEHLAILSRVAEPESVAEVAAHLNLALGVVRVLLGDLLDDGLIDVHHPDGAQRPDDDLLKAVIDGLRAL